jgi:glutamate---cysteine ligase / carboxylate-amine ligase
MSAGGTIGLEEEFHVLDPETYELVPYAPQRLSGAADENTIEAELLSSTVETATAVCESLSEFWDEVLRQRRALCAAAERVGVVVATAGTVPASNAKPMSISTGTRYAWMAEEYGQLAAEQAICAGHVHVGVPDRELAVAIAMRLRAWLPILLAISASSPYFRYGDTGYASYRTLVWSRWPTAGPPPTFYSAQHYDDTIAALVASGTITDAGMIYYDIRPSARYPTVEIRVADGCPAVEDVVLIAALSRALVIAAEIDELAGTQRLEAEPTLLRSATWRAARSGTAGQLVDPVTGMSRPAAEVVDQLLAYVQPALEDRGEWSTVKELVDAHRRRGTSASRQRAAWERRGDWTDVGRLLAEETAAVG